MSLIPGDCRFSHSGNADDVIVMSVMVS